MKKRKSVAYLVLFRVMPFQFKTTPVLDTVVILLGVALGLLMTSNAMAMQYLLDSISDVAKNGGRLLQCLVPMIALAGATIGVELVQGIFNFLADIIFKKSSGKIKVKLFEKIQHIDPAKFEDPSFLDEVNRSIEGMRVMPYFCMSMCICISFYLVYFISVGGYLYSLKPLLLITILLAFIPAMLGHVIRLRVYWKLEQESVSVRRAYEYYQKTMCDREFYKETRTLGAFGYFFKLFRNALSVFCQKQWKTEKKASLIQISLDAISFVGMGISTIILFNAVLAGEISVGAFAAVFTALRAIFGMMRQIICEHIANISQEFGKVANFFDLLDMSVVTGETGVADMSKGVVLDNVSFTYWGREVPAIKNVSLRVNPKETVAIVGENGAGKSTLVRLLIGIYRPSEGEVYVGGLSTYRTDPESLFKGISGVFQKVQKYKMTLQDNVILGVPDELAGSSNKQKIKDILTKVGFENKEIPLDSMLSPEYGGIDISGGQWQRLAIARGLYRYHDLIVLDEPTAAIDPIEETNIYYQFKKMSEGKCSVIVTHRIGSVKLADRIIVLDGGEIVETGTHDQLMALGGKYADMYQAQAQWYEREESKQV